MNLLLAIFYYAILKSAFSVSVNVTSQTNKQIKLQTHLERSTNIKYASTIAEKKEYFFVNEFRGKVTIIDSDYNLIASYKLSEFLSGIRAIVDDKIYNINANHGVINSTNVENIMTSNNAIEWSTVGEFPKETADMSNQAAAVNGSSIYFVTMSGILYHYNITTKLTFEVGKMSPSADSDLVSMVIVDQILYINRKNQFYSFDGTSITEITTPEKREQCGLFQLGNQICRLGGNTTATFPDPVSCYDPKTSNWTQVAVLDEFRWYPAIASSQRGVHVFGGQAYVNATNRPWRNTCLFYDQDAGRFGFFPSPFSEAPVIPQAIVFSH